MKLVEVNWPRNNAQSSHGAMDNSKVLTAFINQIIHYGFGENDLTHGLSFERNFLE